MTSDGGTIEQLAKVRKNLNDRVNEGIARVLSLLRISEEKEVLAENALSLLRNVLDDSLHVPKSVHSSANMKIIASFPNRTEDNESFAAEIENAQTLRNTGIRKDISDCGDILQSTTLHQYVDESQQHLVVAVIGTLTKHPWAETCGNRVSMNMRLDITMQSKNPMAWEITYIRVDQPGQKIQLSARAPWQCILANATTPENDTWADLRVVIEEQEHSQYLGTFAIYSSAMLLQKSVLQSRPSESKKLVLSSEEETIIATGNQNIALFEQRTSGVEIDAAAVGSLTRIAIKASSMITLASYISALRLTVADPVRLRLLGTSRRFTDVLETWLKALQNETNAFRRTAATKCIVGLDDTSVLELLKLQTSLDEACGVGKEVCRL